MLFPKNSFKGKRMHFIPMAKPDLSGNESRYVQECVKSGWIGFCEGEHSFVTKFEREFSRYCGAKYGISTSNGTCSLNLIFQALGIGKGSEVIVPDLTFIAAVSTVLYANAKPVLVDVDRETGSMDPKKLEEKITKKTRAIVPVHLYGHPADLDPIAEIAGKNNLAVIEDAAQAHGAEYKGKRAGSIGDYASFSFYGNKLITTGEGGMVLSDDRDFVEKAKLIRNQGMLPKKPYWHPVLGYNYRLSNIQAAIGLAQLERIDKFLRIKRKISRQYTELLEPVKGISLFYEKDWAKSSCWMYNILIENDSISKKRQLIEAFKKNKIDFRPIFYPAHSMPPFRCDGEFPVSDELSKKGLTLPTSIFLAESDLQRIADVIKSVVKK